MLDCVNVAEHVGQCMRSNIAYIRPPRLCAVLKSIMPAAIDDHCSRALQASPFKPPLTLHLREALPLCKKSQAYIAWKSQTHRTILFPTKV